MILLESIYDNIAWMGKHISRLLLNVAIAISKVLGDRLLDPGHPLKITSL